MTEINIKALARNAVSDDALTRPDWRKSAQRDTGRVWLDKNENFDPVLNRIAQDILCNIGGRALYGYPDTSFLYAKLAEYLCVKPDNLMLSHGSDGVIRSVFEAFINKGDKVLCTNPTFVMYEVYSQMYGADFIKVDYCPSDSGPVLPYDRFISEIRNQAPKLVCLANPDSPSGTVFLTSELRKIIEAVKDIGALILIDEAYYPFSEVTALPWIEEFPNLIIARTFAKAWGLAGLRIGHSAAAYETTVLLHKVRPMYEVNSVAVAVVEKMLERTDDINASVGRLREGMHYFLQEMQSIGFRTVETHGNFGLVSFGGRESSVHEALKDVALYRQSFPHPSLKGYSRFSSAPADVMQKIIDRVREVC